MALINCPECGRENVSDSAESCPNCGYGVKLHFEKLKQEQERLIQLEKLRIANEEKQKQLVQEAQQRAEEQERKKAEEEAKSIAQKALQKKVKIGILIATILIVIIYGLAYIINNHLIPNEKYSKATQLITEENYEQAQGIFEELGDYKDSVEKAKHCQHQIILNNIAQGIELENALEYLNSIALSEEDKTAKINCLWQLAQARFSNKNYLKTIHYLDELSNLELLGAEQANAKQMLEDSLWKYADSLYNDGNFSEALVYCDRYEKLSGSEHSIKKVAKFLDSMQGTWYSDRFKEGLEINKWNLKTITYSLAEEGKINRTDSDNIKELVLSDDRITIYDSNDSKIYIEYKSGKIIKYFEYIGYKSGEWEYDQFTYSKTDNLPKEKPEPRIGMTASELRESKWGEPEDINKDTYSWGTKEQWCYSGYRYVYLENGIVTSISE